MSLLLVPFTQAQTLNWNITGAGARAEGLGGAFIGVADDATAIVWNPAGLTQLERTEISVVGRYISESTNDKDVRSGTTIQNTYSHPSLNFGSLAVPISAGGMNIVPAIAYQRQLDFFFKQSDSSLNTEATGGVSTITPGIAFRLGSVFSVGGATNIWLGSAEYTDAYSSGTTNKYEYTFNGLNFVLGALIDLGGLPSPIPFKLGFVAKTPFKLKADVTVSNTKINLEVEMPLMAGVGASYQIGESFTVSADYEMRMFKDKKLTTSALGVSSSTDFSAHNENLGQFRIGAEYLLIMGGGVIPLRGGFRTIPTLSSNFEWDPTLGAYKSTGPVSGIGFSAGTGFVSTSFALDFAYSRDQYNEQKWVDAGTTLYSYNYSADRFSGSLIVYF